MMPTPDKLAEVTRHREGSLKEVHFPILLQALASQEVTAVLEIRQGPIKKQIIFELGVPVDCHSNLVHETLGRVLVTLGKLTSEEQDAYFREAVSQGVALGEVLRAKGILDSYELYRVLQQNLAKKLLDGFTWRGGEYELRSDPPEVLSPLKVKVPQLVITGVTRFSPMEQVNAAIGPLVGQKLVIHPASQGSLGEIKLDAGQTRMVELLRTPKRLDELAQNAPLAHGDMSRMIYALALLGILVPESSVPKEAFSRPAPAPEAPSSSSPTSTPSPTRPPAASPAAEPGPSPAETTRLRNEVMGAYLAHRRQDAFDLLGVPEDAPVSSIRRAYLIFAQHYAPWRFQGPELRPLLEKAEDLFLAGARAFGELMSTEQRNTLIFRRKTLREDESKQSKTADHFRIQTDLLDSEKQFKKGKTLMEARRYQEALSLLTFASDCDPQNGLYRAEAAYCRFLLSPGSNAQAALDELEEALRMDAKAGLAAFYAGEIHRSLGHWDEAEGYLRQANQLMAPDRRPIETLKILQRQRKSGR